uniref:Protein cornichon 4 n=1 Tax=Castor canadensis TaxID=51338 RepID=A0A8C0ZT01_CASCN
MEGGGVCLLSPQLLCAHLPLGLLHNYMSHLECDQINARSCCSKLNKWVIPELIGHTIVSVLMLVSLHWFIFLLNLPVTTWNIYQFIMCSGSPGGVPVLTIE